MPQLPSNHGQRRRDPATRQDEATLRCRRVTNAPAVMVGEDFSRFYLTDTSIESLMLWVGATPRDKWDTAGGDTHKLPSLHSPFFAPDADAVISTATEAMTISSLDVLKK